MARIKAGDKGKYRSTVGDRYDAVVRLVREDGTVNIDVTCSPRPGDILFLGMVTVHETRRMAFWPMKESK